MKTALLLPTLLTLMLASVAGAQTGDADLRRCRGIAEAAARLTCYDALPLAAATATAAPAAVPAHPVAAPAGTATAAAPAALPTAAPAAATAVATTAAATPPTAAAAAVLAAPSGADAASFGLPRRADEVKEITSHIPGRFEGWSRDTRIRLANGQVWQVVESGRVYYPNLENPKVTVRRAALGSFLMDIEGVAATPRVRRVE